MERRGIAGYRFSRIVVRHQALYPGVSHNNFFNKPSRVAQLGMEKRGIANYKFSHIVVRLQALYTGVSHNDFLNKSSQVARVEVLSRTFTSFSSWDIYSL